MSNVSFADIIHQSLAFSDEVPSQALLLKLIDTRWVQRLRDISQTANTRLVYMFSEHSRFGHSLGVAYLAESLMEKLSAKYQDRIARYRNAVTAAAILHDVGHLAPGSHTAFRTWFPRSVDIHEEIASKIINEDAELQQILGRELSATVCAILAESSTLPPWTWEIISGGGWNVDRGNWCIVDSIMAGVKYGQYNIPALTESIVLTEDNHLALRENRLDAMMHFAVSRHAMYRQVYQHRVLLAADMLNQAIVQRARDLGVDNVFADSTMRIALATLDPSRLTTKDIYQMREFWWRYHLMQWSQGEDAVLADLADRLLNRRLFKTVRIPADADNDSIRQQAERAVSKAGFDTKYYLHEISTFDMQAGDLEQSMPVMMESGQTRRISDADPLINALLRETRQERKRWFALPTEAKLNFSGS